MKVTENAIKLAGSLCDKYGRMKLSAVIERFVDMAGEQTDEWEKECDFPKINASWIINKYDIKIYRFPEKNDLITLRTYQSRYTKHFCERIFAVYGQGDELLVRMVSFWSLRDLESMKIVSVPEEYSRFTYEEGITEKSDKKMAKNVSYERSVDMYIRSDDFDTNMHVNNAKYFSFLYECDDVMDYEEYFLDEVLLTFAGGINEKEGNILHYSSEDTDYGKKLSQKITCNNGQTACVSESYWRKR